MNILIISNENNILHICNEGYSVDYTLYNSKGHNLDGGILESSSEKFQNETVTNDIINSLKNRFLFSSPYIHLKGERAENLLELIQMEDYKNSQKNVDNYLSSLKLEKEKEIEKEI